MGAPTWVFVIDIDNTRTYYSQGDQFATIASRMATGFNYTRPTQATLRNKTRRCVGFGVWRLAFGVWRLASGVWRLASGVWRLAFMHDVLVFGL